MPRVAELLIHTEESSGCPVLDANICIYLFTFYILVTFQPGDAVQKSKLNFLKFYFNLRFFFVTNFVEYGIIFDIFQI